jgi:hypothetical protein
MPEPSELSTIVYPRPDPSVVKVLEDEPGGEPTMPVKTIRCRSSDEDAMPRIVRDAAVIEA